MNAREAYKLTVEAKEREEKIKKEKEDKFLSSNEFKELMSFIYLKIATHAAAASTSMHLSEIGRHIRFHYGEDNEQVFTVVVRTLRADGYSIRYDFLYWDLKLEPLDTL